MTIAPETPTAPLPLAASKALRRLEWALNPAARLESVQAECRRRSLTAVSSADFDALLVTQDELAMCRCRLDGAA